MGGKTKNSQRTKNNVKPSSSARSAELLGSAPVFVGFSAHSDLGLVPFVPGFASAEQMPDTFDASISTPYQLTLKKMSKKDPMTKKKALQEFIDLIQQSELAEIKIILPIWPKFYHNLATDPEHNVRELSQTVLQILVTKCKKAIAPYLKLLVPVWLASQFDNYAPAASIAAACFADTFASNSNRTREVCLHCQMEIFEYASKNLTFHTAATLSTGKSLTPDEAEQKYQRVVVSSLKELSFFVEHTAEAADQTQIKIMLEKLLGHPKFFSFAKNKLNAIRAGWFELIYQLLQSPKLSDVVRQHQTQITTISFQNIDDSDPLVAPHIWGCILLIQTIYNNWFETIDFHKTTWPKFCALQRNAFGNNALAICPNVLPFFSQISKVTTDKAEYHNLVREFFNNLREVILNEKASPKSKQEFIAIIKTYFECLRYLIQNVSNGASAAEDQEFMAATLAENVMQPLQQCLKSSNGLLTRHFFQHASALVAFLDRQQDNGIIFAALLNQFWSGLFSLTAEELKNSNVEELFLERVVDLINELYVANPSLEEHKVKFMENTSNNNDEDYNKEHLSAAREKQTIATYRQRELKQLVVQLLRICLQKTSTLKTSKYAKHIRLLCNMFTDEEFFIKLTESNTILASLHMLLDVLKASFLERIACNILVDVVFDVLQHVEKEQRFLFIQQELIKIPHHITQTLVLHRLLSYPLCIEPAVRQLLSQPTAMAVISKVAVEVVDNNCKDLFNLLHKCFFQTDSGEILISMQLVDKILLTLSQPLTMTEEQIGTVTDVDACGSFIAQIMPVVCSKENSSLAVQHEVFLRLFRFTIEKSVCEFVSEDTMWEITTCWQDALSSKDITITGDLMEKCASIVKANVKESILTPDVIDRIAEAATKLLTCSTEHITDDDQRAEKVDEMLKSLLIEDSCGMEGLLDTCLLIEVLETNVTPSSGLSNNVKRMTDLKGFLQISLLNFSCMCNLVCNPLKASGQAGAEPEGANDDEITEDYCNPCDNLLVTWSDYFQTQLIKFIKVAAAADSLACNFEKLDGPIESLCLELSEKTKYLFLSSGDLSVMLKERLMAEAVKEQDVATCRSLPYLVNVKQFSQFEDSANLLLADHLQEELANRKAFAAYVHVLQYMLSKLENKTIDLQCPIMQCEPREIWVKAKVFRCLVENNFQGSYNDKDDVLILDVVLQFVLEHADKLHQNKEMLVFQTEIQKQSNEHILNAVTFNSLLATLLRRAPHRLSIKHWDVVRIGLAQWILSVTKSLDHALEKRDATTLYFAVKVFTLFAELAKFFDDEKTKSSTELIKSVYDEWLQVFSRDVYLTLFQTFYRICDYQEIPPHYADCWEVMLVKLASTLEYMDFGIVYAFCKRNEQLTLDHVCNFLLKNLSSPIYKLRTMCMFMLRQLTPYFVRDDIEYYDAMAEQIDKDSHKMSRWHFLNRFEDYLGRYDLPIRKYIEEFSFKLTEVGEMAVIDRHEALSYLLLWDCIIYACAKSPVSLRSVYTSWLHEHKYEENLLHFLFRAMPTEILKNYSSKHMNSEIFTRLTWTQLQVESNFQLEKYVCHLYTEALSKLPAVVRKWWHTCPSRQKAFVDTLTTNFVSPIICQEELMAIASKKDKHENMQVTVHLSTREVLAVYGIDEVRMELVITLASNYPLGSVKVDCNKQIGGRGSSRNVAMQLTIFLTHQNGTILDGLALWKNNLDKKFEGVEECYVCYAVIHQDTCQLPKLTCKTCKKKFHGPCLYKWFTTSSKSTCPICRNIF